MKIEKKMMFLGVDSRPGFKDPSKMTNRITLADGMDSITAYISDDQYRDLSVRAPYTFVSAVLEYVSSTGRMNFVSLSDAK